MPTKDLNALLAANPYPGRGILLGLAPDGIHAVAAYFIMGRSENSRNRVFAEADGGIVTQAADPAKVTDPSLIIYSAVRRCGEHTIVTNGDQTDTIYEALEAGGSFEGALRTRTFEPDAPNFTPRISGLLSLGFEGFGYRLSILKAAGEGRAVRRFFYKYPQPLPGEGHFISTYAGDGNPLPSFAGEPVCVAVPASFTALGDGVWRSLNEENKVSLFVRSISLEGAEETRVYNKYDSV